MCVFIFVFFFNDTATTEIYTLSLHDALPIWIRVLATQLSAVPPAIVSVRSPVCSCTQRARSTSTSSRRCCTEAARRSEEHTSELQSRQYLVCRLLLEKKKYKKTTVTDDVYKR